jgi:hypothetical protein
MKSFRRFIATIVLLFGLTCRLSMGADWTAINNGIAHLDIRVLAIDPVNKETIYAGGRSGLFKTVDGGATWNMTGVVITGIPGLPTVPLTTSGIVVRLAIDPVNPNTLYAVTQPYPSCGPQHSRVLKSSDGGATWTDSISPKIGCFEVFLVLAPSDPDMLYLTNADGGSWTPLLRSPDGAATWGYLRYPMLNVLAVDPLDSFTVYGGTFNFKPYLTTLPNRVLKSSNGGTTWEATGLVNSGITAVTMDPKNPRTIYAATGNVYHPRDFPGLFKSVDAGASWAAIDNGLSEFIGTLSIVSTIVVDPDDSDLVYIATAGGGVYRTVDGAATWTPFNDGLQDLTIRSLALAPGEPNTLYAGTPSGVFVNDDLPVLSLEAPRLCVGAPLTLSLRKGGASRSTTLLGMSNSESWEVRDWHTTDAAGHFATSGTFAAGTEGTHILRISVGGVLSNSISFAVSNCRAEETE